MKKYITLITLIVFANALHAGKTIPKKRNKEQLSLFHIPQSFFDITSTKDNGNDFFRSPKKKIDITKKLRYAIAALKKTGYETIEMSAPEKYKPLIRNLNAQMIKNYALYCRYKLSLYKPLKAKL